MDVSSRCLDVSAYCKCQLEDPEWDISGKYTNNPSFLIYRGNQEVEWDREGRNLFGDADLINNIRMHMTEEYTEILKPGFWLWMSVHDPNAVYFVAKHLLQGCTFSKSAPHWSAMENPNSFY